MFQLRLKRTKIANALSCSGPDDVFLNWNAAIPRVLVYGDKAPIQGNGIRYFPSKPNPPVRNLLGTYLFEVHGLDVCFLASPDIYVGGDQNGLLDLVDKERMEMAWGAHCDLDGKPAGFILSSAVVGHIMMDIPQSMKFSDNWKSWLHDWLTKRLQRRYIDATPYGIVVPIPQPTTAQRPVVQKPKSSKNKKHGKGA